MRVNDRAGSKLLSGATTPKGGVQMKPKRNFSKTIPIVLVLTLALAFPFMVFGKAHNTYKMTGKIRGIDLNYQTIVDRKSTRLNSSHRQ